MKRISPFLSRRSPFANRAGWARRTGALRRRWAAALAWLLVLAVENVSGAAAEDVITGPVPAVVEEVVDGDTLKVRAHIWLGQDVEIFVRLAGVDTPEPRGACEQERKLARTARDFVVSRLASGGAEEAGVRLHDVRYGKFARRVVARVETASGLDLGAALLAAGLARPYDGARRQAWCG